MKGEKKPHRLAQAAASPVSDYGRTDLLGGGKTRPGCVPGLGPASGLDDQELAALESAIRDKQEFTPDAEALDGGGRLI